MKTISLVLSVPGAFVTGLFSMLSSGRLMFLFMGQLLVGLVTYALIAWTAFSYRTDMTAMITGPVDSWWEQILSYLFVLVLLAVDGVLTYLVMMIAGGFLMEWYVQTLLKKNGVPVDEELTWRAMNRMVRRTVRVSLLRLLAGAIVIGLFLIALFFPPFGLIASVLVICLLGFDFLELAVSVTGHEVRNRIQLYSDYKALVLVFGAISTFLLAIPFVGLVFMPIIVGAAAELVTLMAKEGQ